MDTKPCALILASVVSGLCVVLVVCECVSRRVVRMGVGNTMCQLPYTFSLFLCV